MLNISRFQFGVNNSAASLPFMVISIVLSFEESFVIITHG